MSIPPGRPILRATFSAALLIGCGGVLSGCPQAGTPGAAPAKAAGLARAPDVSYTTRGIVESLPTPDKPTSEFIVRHEAIDNFLNPVNGNLGMNAMSMPFTLGKDVSLGTIKVGDKVSLTFGVWYKPAPGGDPSKKAIDTYAVTSLSTLPADTVLEFRPAKPTPAKPDEPKKD